MHAEYITQHLQPKLLTEVHPYAWRHMSISTTARRNTDVVIKIHENTTIFQSIHGDNFRLQKSNYFYITALFQALFLTGYNLYILLYVYILMEYFPNYP